MNRDGYYMFLSMEIDSRLGVTRIRSDRIARCERRGPVATGLYSVAWVPTHAALCVHDAVTTAAPFRAALEGRSYDGSENVGPATQPGYKPIQ